MKISQNLDIEGITITLSFEAPVQAVKTLIGDGHAFQEFCSMEYDIRQEAHPYICKTMSSALLQIHHEAHGSLLKAFFERQQNVVANQASQTSHQTEAPETS